MLARGEACCGDRHGRLFGWLAWQSVTRWVICSMVLLELHAMHNDTCCHRQGRCIAAMLKTHVTRGTVCLGTPTPWVQDLVVTRSLGSGVFRETPQAAKSNPSLVAGSIQQLAKPQLHHSIGSNQKTPCATEVHCGTSTGGHKQHRHTACHAVPSTKKLNHWIAGAQPILKR